MDPIALTFGILDATPDLAESINYVRDAIVSNLEVKELKRYLSKLYSILDETESMIRRLGKFVYDYLFEIVNALGLHCRCLGKRVLEFYEKYRKNSHFRFMTKVVTTGGWDPVDKYSTRLKGCEKWYNIALRTLHLSVNQALKANPGDLWQQLEEQHRLRGSNDQQCQFELNYHLGRIDTSQLDHGGRYRKMRKAGANLRMLTEIARDALHEPEPIPPQMDPIVQGNIARHSSHSRFNSQPEVSHMGIQLPRGAPTAQRNFGNGYSTYYAQPASVPEFVPDVLPPMAPAANEDTAYRYPSDTMPTAHSEHIQSNRESQPLQRPLGPQVVRNYHPTPPPSINYSEGNSHYGSSSGRSHNTSHRSQAAPHHYRNQRPEPARTRYQQGPADARQDNTSTHSRSSSSSRHRGVQNITRSHGTDAESSSTRKDSRPVQQQLQQSDMNMTSHPAAPNDSRHRHHSSSSSTVSSSGDNDDNLPRESSRIRRPSASETPASQHRHSSRHSSHAPDIPSSQRSHTSQTGQRLETRTHHSSRRSRSTSRNHHSDSIPEPTQARRSEAIRADPESTRQYVPANTHTYTNPHINPPPSTTSGICYPESRASSGSRSHESTSILESPRLHMAQAILSSTQNFTSASTRIPESRPSGSRQPSASSSIRIPHVNNTSRPPSRYTNPHEDPYERPISLRRTRSRSSRRSSDSGFISGGSSYRGRSSGESSRGSNRAHRSSRRQVHEPVDHFEERRSRRRRRS